MNTQQIDVIDSIDTALKTQAMINKYTYMIFCTHLVVASYVASLKLVLANK